jgi:uncharacterized protein
MPNTLELVKEVYRRRFSQNDIDGFLVLCADDIEWVVNGPPTLEKCRSFRGVRGVQEFLNILGESWEFRDFSPREFIADGQTVVVLGEEAGTEKNSGFSFSNRWAHVFDVREGKIVRFREFLCHWAGDQKPPAMSWSTA